MTDSSWEGYFDARGVSPSYYADYRVPEYILEPLGHNKSIKILDFGCGLGQNILALRKLGFGNICGYDIEPAAIEFCKKNGIDIIDGHLTSVDKIQDRYDVIIATHVLEHLPKNEVIDVLTNLRSLLNDHGLIFISVPNAQSNTGCYWMYEDFTHQTLFTAGSLIFVLKRAGFSEPCLHDPDCLIGGSKWKNLIRKFFLLIYRANNKFWNKVTASSYHDPSPIVNSYEIKMIAKK
jgi:cyclopropane fatty-acyl-phospholipid synthase-like methyltransferase